VIFANLGVFQAAACKVEPHDCPRKLLRIETEMMQRLCSASVALLFYAFYAKKTAFWVLFWLFLSGKSISASKMGFFGGVLGLFVLFFVGSGG
jgi:hypothetical protein